MFLERFSKLELCILQHNVSLESISQTNDALPPLRHDDRKKKVTKWRPWKVGETE